MPEQIHGRNGNHARISDEQRNAPCAVMSRREFVIQLSTGIALAGFFFMGDRTAGPSKAYGAAPDKTACPHLKDDVVFGANAGMATIRRSGEVSHVLCAVNGPGAEVLKRLDGQNSVEDISRAIASLTKIPHSEELDAKIAFFISQLAMLGFLIDPFYAYIIEKV
jgi:hypothetical protein